MEVYWGTGWNGWRVSRVGGLWRQFGGSYTAYNDHLLHLRLFTCLLFRSWCGGQEKVDFKVWTDLRANLPLTEAVLYAM